MDILQIPFVGAYELRKKLPLLLSKMQRENDGLVVTQKGKPRAMLLPIKKYLEMKMLNEELEDALKELKDKDYLLQLKAGVEEIKSGKGKEAKKVFEETGV